MPRVIYVRLESEEHAAIQEAAHAARVSLQAFCLAAIQEAAERWLPRPPVLAAEAACEEGTNASDSV